MTSLTTMMGFLPLALNIGEGGDMLQPMAIGTIGGLLLEMPVALLLMACLYTLATAFKHIGTSQDDSQGSDDPHED